MGSVLGRRRLPRSPRGALERKAPEWRPAGTPPATPRPPVSPRRGEADVLDAKLQDTSVRVQHMYKTRIPRDTLLSFQTELLAIGVCVEGFIKTLDSVTVEAAFDESDLLGKRMDFLNEEIDRVMLNYTGSATPTASRAPSEAPPESWSSSTTTQEPSPAAPSTGTASSLSNSYPELNRTSADELGAEADGESSEGEDH